MAINEMIEKARPISMEPTMRSKRTERRSLNAQMLVMAIHVFNNQLLRVHAATINITAKNQKFYLILYLKSYTVIGYHSMTLTQYIYSIHLRKMIMGPLLNKDLLLT